MVEVTCFHCASDAVSETAICQTSTMPKRLQNFPSNFFPSNFQSETSEFISQCLRFSFFSVVSRAFSGHRRSFFQDAHCLVSARAWHNLWFLELAGVHKRSLSCSARCFLRLDLIQEKGERSGWNETVYQAERTELRRTSRSISLLISCLTLQWSPVRSRNEIALWGLLSSDDINWQSICGLVWESFKEKLN